MNGASGVVVALLGAVLGMPQTASAAGSYGAVVEKGVRDCTTGSDPGLVICFESPSLNSQSRQAFLQAWRAAHFYLARSDTGPATMRVRAVSVTTTSAPAGRTVIPYLATGDHVTRELACRDDFRFQASDGVVQLESVVSACKPLRVADRRRATLQLTAP